MTRGNLVSGGQGEATLLTTVVSVDPIYASFDADEQTFLRYGERVAPAGQRAPDRAADRDGAGRRARASPTRARCSSSTTSSTPSTGHDPRPRGLPQPRSPPDARTVRPAPAPRQPQRYRGVLVEDRAVGTDLDRRYVLVVGADRTVESRTVTLGPLVDDLRVVRTGLSAGELVVVSGLQRVRPGAQVDATVVTMGGAR